MATNKKNNASKSNSKSKSNASQNQPKAVQETGNVADMVTVAYNHAKSIEFDMGGGKKVLIRGNAAHLAGQEKGVIPVGRYGYTRIPAEDWDAIQKKFGSMAIFRNGLIFAEASKDRAEDRAEEQEELRHGLEPVNPETTQSEEADTSAGV